MKPAVLTIAGADSSGGAGIAADLRAFAALGVHGCVAVTAVTAQGPEGLRVSHAVPPRVVAAQIDAAADLGARVAKTGLLPTAACARAVAERVRARGLGLVVDPVLATGAGQPLADADVLPELQRLLPIASLVTPNAPEAEALAGMRVRSAPEQAKAAQALGGSGARAVLLKGGHLAGPRIADLLWTPGHVRRFEHPRAPGRFRGTGCTLSAGIAAGLARGLPLARTVEEAEAHLQAALLAGFLSTSGC